MPVHVPLERFAALVQEALESLPAAFQPYLRGLEVRVEDYPDDELMLEWGLVPPNYPFGLYEGPSVWEAEDPRDLPGTLVIYKRPLEEWCQSEEELGDQIRRTVYHELAHRWGFSDEEMFDELRAGVGAREVKVDWAEARRHLEQAEHDLAAGEALWERGFYEWALEAARAAADRALRAWLIAHGEDPAALESEGLAGLWGRALRRDKAFRKFKPLAQLERIGLGMGDPGAPPPKARVRPSRAQQAVELARTLVNLADRVMSDR